MQDDALAAAAVAALAAYEARRDAERRGVPADALAALVAVETDAERAYLRALAARHARP
jgi:hypothetical protein